MTLQEIKSNYYNVEVYTTTKTLTDTNGVEYTEASTLATYSRRKNPASSMDYVTVVLA